MDLLGFTSLKDLLEVILIPITIFALGLWLPRYWDGQKQDKFIKLICYEISKMAPQPSEPLANGRWYQHVPDAFVHADIFRHPSQHVDFILGLPADLSHDLIRLWAQYNQARTIDITSEQAELEFAETGKLWCKYLKETCKQIEDRTDDKLLERIYELWNRLIKAYSSTSMEQYSISN